jgi:predicted permease
VDYVERQHSLARVGAFYWTTYEVIYRPEGGPRVLRAALVEPEFFETLGARPVIGRTFTRAEVAARAFVVMLSYDMWQREFGGDPGVVGTVLHIDTDGWQVVGVLPEDFVGPMGSADVWSRLNTRSGVDDPVRSRTVRSLGMVGRLREGVTVDAARRDLSSITADLGREHPATDGDRGVTVISMRESMSGDTRAPLLAVMGSAAMVLLIACANLAGALLSRSLTRRREFAVRIALGAGKSRLIRQLLTESVMLAMAGAAAGLALAAFGLAALRRLALPALPAYADLSLDGGAIAVTTVLAVFTGVAVGIAPALSIPAGCTQGRLREGTRRASETRQSGRLRGVLVSGQIALCLSLLMGAGLLGRSLLAMTSAPLGYDPAHVLEVSVKGPIPARDERRREFFERLQERVRSLPGVRAVAMTNQVPAPSMSRASFTLEGSADRVNDGTQLVPFVSVTDTYFDAMRIPLLVGRTFGVQDAMGARQAVIISETMARRFWPRGDAIGAGIRVGDDASDAWGEVIGIVADVRIDPSRTEAEPMAYGSSRQSLLRSSQIYLVRTRGDALALADPFRRELSQLDGSVPMDGVGTLESRLGNSLNAQKLPALLLSAFALLALMLAGVGVYALFSSFTSARQQEFGVRIALGSSPAAIALLVLRQGSVWAGAGLSGGALGVVVIAYLLRNLLYDVSPFDPTTIAFVVTTFLLVSATALLIPVRRAARVNATDILW